MDDQSSKFSFNYKVTRFFLGNNRLTILSLLLLLLIGIFSFLSLKTTGFPNPEIKIALVQTIYPGTSSETVVKDITQPIEGAVKNVQGVKSYVSISNNSFSNVTITIDEKSNADIVKSRIDSALKSIKLPSTAESPKIISPQISGPDFVFLISGKTNEEIYKTYIQVSKDLSQISETANVETVGEFKPQLTVKLKDNPQKYGISLNDIKLELQSANLVIPIASNITLDDQNRSIVTALSGQNIDDIKNYTLQTKSGNVLRISDVADLSIDYVFSSSANSFAGVNLIDKNGLISSLTLNVKAVAGTDLSKYTQTVYEKLNKYNSTSSIFIKSNESKSVGDKTAVIEAYAQNYANQQQVDEVVKGLVGGPLKNIDGPLKNLGWILGAIQLIIVVMIAFVSIRAAVVAALSIPLSLLIAIIFLKFAGIDLNTLVLFSFILVLGLVVDPTLVVLEAIQRKKDAGFKGKNAALEAIKDVGNGLFLAILANVIVFIPFGIVSGILGQIFSYIPLTIIPALIGSYIVPLIFLAWIGGIILKPSKKRRGDEEQNLWGLAKWLIRINLRILNSSVWLRLIIIVLALSIPMGVAIYYFGSGKIKQVQFASSDDSEFIYLTGTYLSNISEPTRISTTKSIINLITSTSGVDKVILNNPENLNYLIALKDKSERKILKAPEIADNINNQIQTKFKNLFFDIELNPSQNGPPASSYQVTIGIKSDDFVKLKSASLSVGKTLQKICKVGQVITIDETCSNGTRIVTKVDDGYTNKDNKQLEILFDRAKLNQYQLTIPNTPISALVSTQIKQVFSADPTNFTIDKSIGKIEINNEQIDIVLDQSTPLPQTLEQIKNIPIFSPITNSPVLLSSIAEVKEVSVKSSITRVKGQVINDIQARLSNDNNDQGTAALVNDVVINEYKKDGYKNTINLGLDKESIAQYSEGDGAAFIKSFSELGSAFLIAIILIYIILALFFRSFSMPIVILFTIPLTFLGLFPALSAFAGGQFGFLEIIGIIILTGLVVNVAIFLIDAARQKINNDGWDEKRAISYASGVRLRPVLMTKFTAIASLAPLAIFSEFYRSIAVVIMFGLLTSGFTSLFTTPILFIAFRSLSHKVRHLLHVGGNK